MSASGATTPESSRFRRLPRPTRRGVATLVAGALVATVGHLVGSLPLVFAGIVLLLLVVASLVTVGVRVPRLTVVRRFSPERAVAGWSVTETLTVLSTSSGVASVRIRDTLSWRTMAAGEAVTATLEPGRPAAVSFVHQDLVRGRHRIGPARLDAVESFGLARRLVQEPGRSDLIVYPEVVNAGSGSESRSLGEGARQRRDHSVAGGQDDPITREYRRGDPMRRVHWRATARQGELMVRQEEQHGLPSVRVVLPLSIANWRDAHPAAGSGGPVSEGFEWAVSTCASLAVDYGMAGSQTRVIALDGGTLALHDPSATPHFLELLADLALGDRADERSPEAAPREPVIAIVSSLDVGQIDRLGHLRGPGVQGVALVVHLDGDLLTPSDTEADSPSEVVAALRENGWHVVETDSTADRAEILRSSGVLRG